VKSVRIISQFIIILFSSVLFHREVNAEISQNELSNWKIVFEFDSENTPSGKFQDACALDLDSENNVFIVDRGRNRLIKFSRTGEFLKEIGGFGDGPDQFSSPNDVCARSTLNIYVADYNNNRISRFDANLNYLNEFKSNIDDVIYYEMPLSITVSGQYDIFLLEDLNKRILKLNRFNQPQAIFGDASQNLGQLLSPHQLAISQDDKIFVSDPSLRAVIVFDYLGNYITELKHPEFIHPSGIYLSSRNDLLVADPESQKLFLFEEGSRFLDLVELSSHKIQPIDGAIFVDKGKKKTFLYVLTSTQCIVFTNDKYF
jgi:DNA-binding beta-propeller fold protein YncE